MSRGLSGQQAEILQLIERRGPMTPQKIWAELEFKGYSPSFSNLCRSLRSLSRRGVLERQGVVYHNPPASGIRYLTPTQLAEFRRLLKEKYG